MKIIRTAGFLATSLLVTAAWAQSANPALNLKLPANVPAAAASAAPSPAPAPTAPADTKPTASTAASAQTLPASAPAAQANPMPGAKDPPGTYYGDTSGVPIQAQAQQPVVTCDDATYNQPQVHGAISAGVVSASHGGSGSWQSGGVTLSQAFGSCEHPSGGMNISIGGSTGHFGH